MKAFRSGLEAQELLLDVRARMYSLLATRLPFSFVVGPKLVCSTNPAQD